MMVSTDSAMISTPTGSICISNGASGVCGLDRHLADRPLHRAFEITSRRRSSGVPRSSQLPTVRRMLRFPVADSITTWQLSAAASTLQGNIGSGTAQFRSFQPFFAAFDPPSILTTGDSIALPITSVTIWTIQSRSKFAHTRALVPSRWACIEHDADPFTGVRFSGFPLYCLDAL